MEGSNKSSKGIMAVLVVIIVALASFIGYDKLIKKDKEKDTKGTSNEVSNVESNSNVTSNEVSNQTSNEVSNTTTSNSNTNTNTNIVSSELEKDITKKIALLFNDDTYKSGKSIKSGIPDNMAKYIINNKLTEERKTNIIMTNLKPYTAKKITKNDVKIRNKEIAEILGDDGMEINYYSSSKMAKNFKSLFGTNPSYVDVNGCPGYQYDFKSKDYVSISGCGWASGYTTYVYVDSMVKSGKKVNVKVYAGTMYSDPNKNTYYKDIDLNSKTSKYTTIKESNKKNFTKYTLVFKSDSNGNYYFSNAVK